MEVGEEFSKKRKAEEEEEEEKRTLQKERAPMDWNNKEFNLLENKAPFYIPDDELELKKKKMKMILGGDMELNMKKAKAAQLNMKKAKAALERMLRMRQKLEGRAIEAWNMSAMKRELDAAAEELREGEEQENRRRRSSNKDPRE